MSKGYIYLISASGSLSGLYKIGKASDPSKRMKQFTQMPFKIKLIHMIHCEDMSSVEYLLHTFFASCRENGEWFSLTSEQVDMLLSCPDESALIRATGIRRTPEPNRPVMLRLPEDIYNWLQAKADKERRTINAQAAILFEKLKALEEETDSPPAVLQES